MSGNKIKQENSSVESAQKALDQLLNQKYVSNNTKVTWYDKIINWIFGWIK